jgi:hypothetical protein
VKKEFDTMAALRAEYLDDLRKVYVTPKVVTP